MRDNKLIQFYLTDSCNSQCRTCDIWKSKGLQHLPIGIVKTVMEKFPNADFVFGGGEALNYEHIEELLDFARQGGYNYTLLSNGINLTELVNLVIGYDVKNLTISCDGLCHDMIRRSPGNLDKIVTIFNRLRPILGDNLKVSYTLSHHNIATINEDMKMFRERLNIKKVYFCFACEMDLLHTTEKLEVTKEYFEVAYENKDMLYEKDLAFVTSCLVNERKECDSTSSVFTIYSNGDLVRCQSYLSKNVIGNVMDNTFQALYCIKNAKQTPCRYYDVCNLLCQRRYD